MGRLERVLAAILLDDDPAQVPLDSVWKVGRVKRTTDHQQRAEELAVEEMNMGQWRSAEASRRCRDSVPCNGVFDGPQNMFTVRVRENREWKKANLADVEVCEREHTGPRLERLVVYVKHERWCIPIWFGNSTWL